MRLNVDGMLLTSFEFALLGCISMSGEEGEGSTAAEIAGFMRDLCDLRVLVPSLAAALRRMEDDCYIMSRRRDMADVDGHRGPKLVKAYVMLNRGWESLKAYKTWVDGVWARCGVEGSVPSSVSSASEEPVSVG
jgi:hypothetical protein